MYRDFNFYFSDGECMAFESVVDKYSPYLTAFSYSFLRNIENSKDIVQDVFTKLWSERKTFNSEEHLKRVLYIATKNLSLNILRSSKYHENFLNTVNMETEVDPMLPVVEYEVVRMLEESISKLPERTAKVLKLTLEGFKQEQIAEMMNIEVSSVKTLKRKGIDKLREKYSTLSAFLPFFFS